MSESAPQAVQDPPLISVVTVCYNTKAKLIETIESLKGQKYRGFEFVVVDGNSTDGTKEYLRTQASLITRWVSEPDSGIYSAMNKALGMCTGEYVYFLNAGDTYLSESTLEEVAQLLEDRPALLMNQVIALDPRSGATEIFPKARQDDSARTLFHSAYCHQAAFVRREAYLEVGGFDESFPHFADFKALYTIRSGPGACLETTLPVATFPLDGVSSDWRRAAELYAEKERLLRHFEGTRNPRRYVIGLVRSYLSMARAAGRFLVRGR